FAQMMGQGLGRQWTAALAGTRQNKPPAAESVQGPPKHRLRSLVPPTEVLGQSTVPPAVSANVSETMQSVAAWLANLSLLYPVPFSYLVSDQRLLPVES